MSKCKRFTHRPIAERQALVKNSMLCFGCLLAGHRSKDCKNRLLCDKCKGKHPSVMHKVSIFKKDTEQPTISQSKNIESPCTTMAPTTPVATVVTMCTEICGYGSNPKTCAKTLLVDASLECNLILTKRIYVVIDAQSNVSFIDESLVDYFNVKFPSQSYRMSSAQRGCSIRTKGYQRRVPLEFISILPGIHANHTEKWGVPLVMYGG